MSYKVFDKNQLQLLIDKIALKVKSLIDNKADKATTLSGYGITDGLKKWYGTKEQYDAIATKDDDTVYFVSDGGTTYVTSDTFNVHAQNTSNPHNVTAEQVNAYTKDKVYTKTDVYTKTETDSAISNAVNGVKITVDSELSSTSTNPVQNSVVYTDILNREKSLNTKIINKADKATTLSGYGITDAYTKAETNSVIASATPNITVDSSLSVSSTNPVQNKVVATAINSVQKIYYGTTEPSSSLGKDGDLYILYNN